MTFGSAVNDGVAFNLRQKIDTDTDLPTEQVVEVAVAGLENRRDETEWDEDFASVKDEVPGVVEVYQQQTAPEVHPAAVEEELKITLEGQDWGIIGYIDVRERNGVVRDTKTARRKWQAGREYGELQPRIYTVADEGDSRFVFDILTRGKKPGVDTRPVIVTQNDKTSVLALVAAAKVRADRIMADPDSALPTGYGGNLCSKKWCGFWKECAGRWGLHIKD